jgi:prepilin-type N-terminal cleavage/methylation domain-containing protein
MISAVRTTRPQGAGFTLIEIVMVLALAAVIMGGAVGVMVYSSDERALRKASGQIELLAKKARTLSILHQTAYSLEFSEGAIRLVPLAQAGMDGKKGFSFRKNNPDPKTADADEDRQIKLESGMTLSFRHWNSSEWLSTAKRSVHIWRFDPDGICEPISIRLALGDSWAVDTFHPLTATIRDSELEVR